ncbi:hypothetical protein MMC09_001320 [Bachmanniomyces sp. S44760]|nr:hypothetical protein [Bachmanniomyces sp. S44760]
MSEKRPTSQHIEKEANFAIRGNAKTLQRLSSSGIDAQRRRRVIRRENEVAAESSNQASNHQNNQDQASNQQNNQDNNGSQGASTEQKK